MDENERIPSGNNIISINNQNLEEEEELEERKRREESIHNLLSHAMGEFNFDDQSTLNSSIASKEGDDSVLPVQTQTTYDQQYREANADDQLKLLYEVRVREVLALNLEVEKLTAEFNNKEQVLKKKATLLEIENERKNISLKEAQDLLVGKTHQLKNVNEQLENTEATVKKLEANVSELNQETLILRETNMKLEQQLSLMERGFPLLQQTSDKELRESQRAKISQLENSLDKIMEQMERKERQHKELIREFKQSLQEKDDSLAEKCSLINKLTENFDNAQERCLELLSTVEELRQTQKAPDSSVSPLEEELRKIREYNERTEVLCENIRKVVSEEFQGQIAVLNSENMELKDTLNAQENHLIEVNKQLEIMITLEADRDNLERILREFQTKYEEGNFAQAALTEQLSDCKTESDCLREMCQQLTTDCDYLTNVKVENEKLHEQIEDLQLYINEVMNPTTEERSIQVSFSSESSTEIDNVNKEKEEISHKLLYTLDTIGKLENKIQLLFQENAQLKEREGLVKELQDKAAQFEKIIYEKQKKFTDVKTATIGTNTEDSQENNSLLKVKYDALLYQTETNIRKKLKQEFDAKLEKFTHEAQENIKSSICENCNKLKNEHKMLHELRMKDRQSVVKLVDGWTEKFNVMEKESQISITELKTFYDTQLVSHAIKLEQKYIDRVTAMTEHLKKAMGAMKHQKGKFVHSSEKRHAVMNEKLNKIITKIHEGSKEIAAIEKQCVKNIATLEK